MPGDCPASLHLLLFVCGKHSAPSRTPFRQATKTVRLPTGIGVHLQTGMLFGITTESCSASQRNRVHLRPDSPLPAHDLLFNKKSTDDKSGKANVAAHAGSDVWGVLYTIPDADLDKLDKGEGGYRRVRLSLRLTNNTNTDAWVYVAKKPEDDPALRPYTWYKRFLVEGAREHSLPEDYIAQLERIDAVADTDERRDREKRELACRVAS